MTVAKLRIIDSTGEVWEWDGERIRVEGTDDEFEQEGQGAEGNGYQASTFDEVVTELFAGGYIDLGSVPPIFMVSYYPSIVTQTECRRYFMNLGEAREFARRMNNDQRTTISGWEIGPEFKDIPRGLLVRLLNRDGWGSLVIGLARGWA